METWKAIQPNADTDHTGGTIPMVEAPYLDELLGTIGCDSVHEARECGWVVSVSLELVPDDAGMRAALRVVVALGDEIVPAMLSDQAAEHLAAMGE